MNKIWESKHFETIVIFLMLIFLVLVVYVVLRTSVPKAIDKSMVPVKEYVNELAELREEEVAQAEAYIKDGWTVSLDGSIIEGAVDLNHYYIKLDEESETVILTTPETRNTRTYTHTTYMPIPIFY